jgi:hypothetical protein
MGLKMMAGMLPNFSVSPSQSTSLSNCQLFQELGHKQVRLTSQFFSKNNNPLVVILLQRHVTSVVITSQKKIARRVSLLLSSYIDCGTHMIFFSKFSAGISIFEKRNSVQLVTDIAETLALELYQHQQVAWTEESLK